MALTHQQRAFVREYPVDFNGTKAAERVGVNPNCAANWAYRALINDEVMAAIQEHIEEKLEVAEITVDWVLRQWKQIAEADPGELSWTEVECCRHCHGVNHQYESTEVEFRLALQAAQLHRCGKACERGCVSRVPDPSGGMNFNPKREPAADCPVCHGVGLERVRVADTRRLRGSARRLYAGVKQTKDGIEIKMRDQDAALQNISKYLGMVLERREISGRDGKPIEVAHIRAEDLTDDQLAHIIVNEAPAAVVS